MPSTGHENWWRSTDGSVHIHHPSGEVTPNACWQLIPGDKWLPFWLCWKLKVFLIIKSCYLNYCLLLLWCEKGQKKESVDCKDPFPAAMKLWRIGCKLRGHLWSLLACRPQGSRKTPSFHYRGDADSERKHNSLQGHGLSLRGKELMKEATKRWQGNQGGMSLPRAIFHWLLLCTRQSGDIQGQVLQGQS